MKRASVIGLNWAAGSGMRGAQREWNAVCWPIEEASRLWLTEVDVLAACRQINVNVYADRPSEAREVKCFRVSFTAIVFVDALLGSDDVSGCRVTQDWMLGFLAEVLVRAADTSPELLDPDGVARFSEFLRGLRGRTVLAEIPLVTRVFGRMRLAVVYSVGVGCNEVEIRAYDKRELLLLARERVFWNGGGPFLQSVVFPAKRIVRNGLGHFDVLDEEGVVLASVDWNGLAGGT